MGFFDFEEGFSDAIVGTIDKVEFAPNNFGALQATLTILRDEPFTGKDGALVTSSPIWVTVGNTKDWEACDGGNAFCRVDGDEKKNIRSNSQYAELLERVVELIGEDAAKSRFGDGYKDGRSLVGLHLEWDREGAGKDYKFTDKDTGEIKEGKTRGRMMPLALAESNGKSATSAPADLTSLGIDDETLQTLRNLAEAYSGGKFASEAINLLAALVAGGQSPEQQKAFIGALGDGSLEAALNAQI